MFYRKMKTKRMEVYNIPLHTVYANSSLIVVKAARLSTLNLYKWLGSEARISSSGSYTSSPTPRNKSNYTDNFTSST